MLTRVNTATLSGVSGSRVTVEADVHRGLPSFRVVGLADATIREAGSRIRPAILNSGYSFPDGRVTVNLSPAGDPKEGSHFDLPIAIGILMLEGIRGTDWKNKHIKDTAFLGELSLDGKINRIKGALPLAMSLRNGGIKNIILPLGNAEEVSLLKDISIFPVTALRQAVDCLSDLDRVKQYKVREAVSLGGEEDMDFSQVLGQETAKRAALIAAAGGHGLLMMGGPGCGKTMIARRISTILPPLTYEEKLEITGIYSVAGMLSEKAQVIACRPFRNPHHTVSVPALVGGGSKPKPGEISLAHRGVLFLDEFGEFQSKAIDALRQPLEEGFIRIKRSFGEVLFPSDVMPVIAANPCKCGNLWDEKRACICTSGEVRKYMKKIFGPVSDRIDIHVRMQPVSRDELILMGADSKNSACSGYSSGEMRRQVSDAMAIQRSRYSASPYMSNGRLNDSGIKSYCQLDDKGRRLMEEAYDRLGLSMRAYKKILKVARTIADLEGAENISRHHVAEAIMYRAMDVR